MGKPGLSMFSGRRKSSINALDEVQPVSKPEPAPATDNGGFRVLDQATVQARKAQREREEATKKSHEKSSKFGRFSSFGASGGKARHQSFDDDSLSSSKRDSKSSSGTHSSRPYNVAAGQYGSTSTLPSSADTDPSDNMFANLPPRPHIPQHNSSPNGLSMGMMRKDLPPPPPTKSRTHDFSSSGSSYSSPYASSTTTGRTRALTTSSYASTAIPPKLESDLDFGASSFSDMFGTIDRKESPDQTHESPSVGRSLLAGKRGPQIEPIQIESRLEVEPPMKSWDSRGSNDHLIASPTETEPSPPPPPPHKYTPVASDSPELRGSGGFQDADARIVRQSFIARSSVRESPAQKTQASTASSSAVSLQTPTSSRSASDNTTPRNATHTIATSLSDDEDDDDLFAAARQTPIRKPAPQQIGEKIPLPPPVPDASLRRVMTAAEYRAQQERQKSQAHDDSSDSEDYEDEEEAIERREQEQRMIRKRQQQSMAREELRRTTTAPSDLTHPVVPTMGFSPDIALTPEDEDDDVPLGILAAHGFPKSGRPPTQPSNAGPSYFLSTTPGVPDRPASAGALGNRASAYKPPFARNLPDDPHASFIGGGLVRPTIRESMGFNRSTASVYGEPTGPSSHMLPYHEPNQPHMSLVEQIHARDLSKPKYMGGASTKTPQGGPFTGTLASQMNPVNAHSTRMSQMPMHQGMMGGMMGGMNPTMMAGQMPMMGMNPMAYSMPQADQLMQMQQMQQMLMQQQWQLAQYAQAQQQQQQPQFDPRMSMASPKLNLGVPGQFQNTGFLNVGPGAPSQRPMSIMSQAGAQQARPYSTPSQFGSASPGFGAQLGPAPGYTPSIAPSERSNIGLSARYRPVVTGSGIQDGVSTVSSSQTLQAPDPSSQPRTVKGILKKVVPQVTVKEDDEENWGSLVQGRKNKYASNGANGHGGEQNAFGDLAHLSGVEGF